jgi:glutathione-regulated potassium-efflux system ancillary protein KefG
MKNILLLFAHPRYEKSRVNRALLAAIRDADYITVRDMYEQYSDFNIDPHQERQLLLSHQIIVWQHPVYMYSAPALVKQWIDMVLEHGWAHGPHGNNLAHKMVFNAITSGGTRESYAAGGFNRFSIQDFLKPFEQTAALCNMVYLPPFAVQGTYLLSMSELEERGALYRSALHRLACGTDTFEDIGRYAFLNDWIAAVANREKP